MLRLIVFLALLAALAFGISIVADQPGGMDFQIPNLVSVHTTVLGAVGVVLATAVVISILWGLFRFAIRAPSIFNYAREARRRRKGYEALTRGMVAAGAGDARAARKAAADVARHLPKEPLGLLLHAQVAQLGNDRAAAEAAFASMAKRDETRLLGLRGLHIEAQRRGDAEAAHHFAKEAHKAAALPWAGEAVVSHQASHADWAGALATVEANARAKTIDFKTSERQRAVLETAIAQENELVDPERALKLAQQAAKRAPDLTPAVALAARLLARRGAMRAASKMVERAFASAPHPDLAAAYLDMRPGDSNADRYSRAKALARLAPENAESRLVLARAALASRDYVAARAAMAPLVEGDARPTARMCLLMAEIEESENGETGLVREWLSRGSRAPRDPAWTADGVVSNRWAPVSPVTGALDAFRWTTPVEQAGLAAPEPTLAPIASNPTVEQPAIIEATADRPVVTTIEAVPAPQATPAPGAATLETSAAARPVIFPLPTPPDDPGPENEIDLNTRRF
jgi:HemY protein